MIHPSRLGQVAEQRPDQGRRPPSPPGGAPKPLPQLPAFGGGHERQHSPRPRGGYGGPRGGGGGYGGYPQQQQQQGGHFGQQPGAQPSHEGYPHSQEHYAPAGGYPPRYQGPPAAAYSPYGQPLPPQAPFQASYQQPPSQGAYPAAPYQAPHFQPPFQGQQQFTAPLPGYGQGPFPSHSQPQPQSQSQVLSDREKRRQLEKQHRQQLSRGMSDFYEAPPSSQMLAMVPRPQGPLEGAGAAYERKRTEPHGGPVGHPVAKKARPTVARKSETNKLKDVSTAFIGHMHPTNTLPAVPLDPFFLLSQDDQSSLDPSAQMLLDCRDREPTALYREKLLGIQLDLVDLEVFLPPKDEDLELDPRDEEFMKLPNAKGPLGGTLKRAALKNPAPQPNPAWPSSSPRLPLPLPPSQQQQQQQGQLPRGRSPSSSQSLTPEELADLVEKSFENARGKPVHPRKPHLQAERVYPLLPDNLHWGRDLEIVQFHSDPFVALGPSPEELRQLLPNALLDLHLQAGSAIRQKNCLLFLPHQLVATNGNAPLPISQLPGTPDTFRTFKTYTCEERPFPIEQQDTRWKKVDRSLQEYFFRVSESAGDVRYVPVRRSLYLHPTSSKHPQVVKLVDRELTKRDHAEDNPSIFE